ncbi:hypothetical protein G4X40_18575 [Rhodococcus sp. D2-41]|uniref:hypothetical protein n=1 Tax=Speluncibacter jeojiensis TaxID=2710754 RepID=UPI00241060D8|nr:hypothetical protein [Rhodococcus sp. D2-41]MDG3012151.1 hypothetical protein [Rhodococcus sp. D2-41]
MSFTVIAPLVVVADELGRLGYHYRGATIEHLADADAHRLADAGLIVSRGGRIEPPQVKPVKDGRPAATAPKSTWVAYAVAQGLEQAEAEKLSKSELIALAD